MDWTKIKASFNWQKISSVFKRNKTDEEKKQADELKDSAVKKIKPLIPFLNWGKIDPLLEKEKNEEENTKNEKIELRNSAISAVKKLKKDQKSFDKFSWIFKTYILKLFHINYEFTEEELKKELKEKRVSHKTKKMIFKIFNEINDINYSGKEIKKEEFNNLIHHFIKLVDRTIPSEKEVQQTLPETLPSPSITENKPKSKFIQLKPLIKKHKEKIIKRFKEKIKRKHKTKKEILETRLKKEKGFLHIIKKRRHEKKLLRKKKVEEKENQKSIEKNKELLNQYLNYAFNKGMEIKKIKESLIEKGWPKKFITDYCKKYFEKTNIIRPIEKKKKRKSKSTSFQQSRY